MRASFAIALALTAVAAHADQYGFTDPPYDYSDEYRRNEARCPRPWHEYQPGYHRCSGEDRHKEEMKETRE
jgi:hypothetical protein